MLQRKQTNATQKTKRPLFFQVADFDFGQADEEELQYKSFWERLRESFSEFIVTVCIMPNAIVIVIL